MPCELSRGECKPGGRNGRHAHPAADLNQTDEKCRHCQVSDWWVWFGGPLPAMIRCGTCGRGFNLSARFQSETRTEKTGAVA